VLAKAVELLAKERNERARERGGEGTQFRVLHLLLS
jgi:hypothetical protein